MDSRMIKKPYEIIAEIAESFASKSDAEVLEALMALEPLPDEASPEWGRQEVWEAAYSFVAFADTAAKRRLRPAILLLLQRACYGDPGEMMRGLRHSLEAIVSPDWRALAILCIEAAGSDRLGTQLWALDQLAILDDELARPTFEAFSASEASDIREAADRGLARLQRQQLET